MDVSIITIGKAVSISLFWPLVLQLGHDDYRTREKVQIYLRANLDLAGNALRLGEKHRDPEIKQRCRPLVCDWFKANAGHLVNLYKPVRGWPWSDSLHFIDMNWEAAKYPESYEYLMKARRCTWPQYRPHIYYYEDYQVATRLWMVDRIAARMPVVELLELLCRGDARSKKAYPRPMKE